MENKETAIEWVKNKCEDSLAKEPFDASEREKGYSIALKHIVTLIKEQAKQMEKEQIINAFYAGIGYDKLIDDCDTIFNNYYKETYEQ